MKIINKIYKEYKPPVELSEICKIEDALFFDIETTGLNKATTNLYLIGCGYYADGCLNTRFFFGEMPDEELTLLTLFFEFAQNYKMLIHFNGTKFDLPYLEYKAQKYEICNPLNDIDSFDIYREIKPLRYLLFRESMKQKCVEDFLGIERQDMFNGGELIPVYYDYVVHHDNDSFNKLMTHNIEDVLGMHKLFPILNYLKLWECNLTYINNKCNKYKDINGVSCNEIILNYSFSLALPKSFTVVCNGLYFKFDVASNNLAVRIPLLDSTMNHYFENYNDYYYLIQENKLIHKSLISGVDKKYLRKASKDECFVPINGLFLPQYDKVFEKACGSCFKNRNDYFLLPEETNSEAYTLYGNHLLSYLLSSGNKRHRKTLI